jgi:phage terminase large subunit-like protein
MIYDSLVAAGENPDRGEIGAVTVVSWIERNIRLVDGIWAGQPQRLAEFQLEPLRAVYGTMNPDNPTERLYTEWLDLRPRKHAKTTDIAQLCLQHLYAEPVPGQQILNIAYDRDQARYILNIGKRMLEQMSQHDPTIAKSYRSYHDRIVIPETDSMWLSLPHNADDIQGTHPRIAICDEVHTYRDDEAIHALRSGMGGHHEPLLIGISTVGQEKRGPLYDWIYGTEVPGGGRKGGIIADPRGYFRHLGLEEGKSPVHRSNWKRASRAPWITMEYLEQQYARMPLPRFEQYHLNRWPEKAINRAFSSAQWAKCERKPSIDPKKPVVIAVDASRTRDHTSVCLVQHNDGEYHVQSWVWKPSDFETGRIDLEAVRTLIERLYREYRVTRIACDRAFMNELLYQMAADGFPVEAFPQDDEHMVPACAYLEDRIIAGAIRAGKNVELRTHVLNVIKVEARKGGYRFDKPGAEFKIDAAIALTMGLTAARAAEAERRTKLSERGGIRDIDI